MTTVHVHVFLNWTLLYVKQDEESFQHGDVALMKQQLFSFSTCNIHKFYDNNHVQSLLVYLITRYFLTFHCKGDNLVNEWPGDPVSMTQSHFPRFC